jgi:hypothetical protein
MDRNCISQLHLGFKLWKISRDFSVIYYGTFGPFQLALCLQ